VLVCGFGLAACGPEAVTGTPAPVTMGGARNDENSAGNAPTIGNSAIPTAGGGVGASGGASGLGPSGAAGISSVVGSIAGTAPESGGSRGDGGVPKLVGVFVAQGHEGRITRSCDGGQTFPYNASADDSFRCFTDADHDCDHSPVAGRGLAFGKGTFVATWGWGHPGKLQQSTDGKTFTDAMSETPTFADVAYGNGAFVACGSPTRVSGDGKIWEAGGKLSFDFNYRGIEYVPTSGGLFIVTGESGTQRAISISKDGKAWSAAKDRPDSCGEQLRGIAGSEQVAVIASAKGHICRSTDGESWTFAQVAERFTSPPLWTGTAFWIYAGAQRFSSADGQNWVSEDTEPKNIAIGALARSDSGTLVAANDGWQVWYEKQQFFRSVDGLKWELLPTTAFTGSHPINFISFGYVPATADCAAP